MKSINKVATEAYATSDGWAADDSGRIPFVAHAVLAHAAAVIREKAETETRSWGARDEWRRVALLLENME